MFELSRSDYKLLRKVGFSRGQVEALFSIVKLSKGLNQLCIQLEESNDDLSLFITKLNLSEDKEKLAVGFNRHSAILDYFSQHLTQIIECFKDYQRHSRGEKINLFANLINSHVKLLESSIPVVELTSNWKNETASDMGAEKKYEGLIEEYENFISKLSHVLIHGARLYFLGLNEYLADIKQSQDANVRNQSLATMYLLEDVQLVENIYRDRRCVDLSDNRQISNAISVLLFTTIHELYRINLAAVEADDAETIWSQLTLKGALVRERLRKKEIRTIKSAINSVTVVFAENFPILITRYFRENQELNEEYDSIYSLAYDILKTKAEDLRNQVIEGLAAVKELALMKDKFEKTGELTSSFAGQLDKAFFAKTLKTVMGDQKLSVRKAAKKGKTNPSTIQAILAADATIDKASEVLSNLGIGFTVKGLTIDLE